MVTDPVRWGIMGTADIARSAFLPALAAAGGGTPAVVAGRERARAESFAHANGVARAVEGYGALLADAEVEAIYIPLPNSLHAEWTMAALRAGKPVLCEKPLCISLDEARSVLDVARETGTLLWEAFVFPFGKQAARLRDLLSSGAIGEPRLVDATFHFTLHGAEDIRFSSGLAGGALNDVGCYCIALARMVFGGEPVKGIALPRWTQEGVDVAADGVLEFGEERRLVVSCAMDRPIDRFCRITGTEGEIRLTNPFHPGEGDVMEVRRGDEIERFPSEQLEPTFTDALRHIHRTIRGLEAPAHLAVDEAMGIAVGLELLHRSARSGRVETP